MSLADTAIGPIANNIVTPEMDTGPDVPPPMRETILQPTLSPQPVGDTNMVDTAMRRLESASAPIEPPIMDEGAAVRSLSSAGDAPQAVFPVDEQAPAAPTFDQAMANFRSATNHAIEISVISTAGSSMAGSMSKLMSGN